MLLLAISIGAIWNAVWPILFAIIFFGFMHIASIYTNNPSIPYTFNNHSFKTIIIT